MQVDDVSTGKPSGKGLDKIFEEILNLSRVLRAKFREESGKGFGPDLEREMRIYSSIAQQVSQLWTVEILYLLDVVGSMTFGQLRRNLKGISSRTLSNRLKSLEKDAFVKRRIIDGHPPKVEYSLNEKGANFIVLASPGFLYLRHKLHESSTSDE